MTNHRAILAGIVAGCLASSAALAQSDADAPLSAIDWLSDVVRAPQVEIVPPAQDVTKDARPSAVTTTRLGQIKIDAVGLLPNSVTGLSTDFWGASSSADLQTLIAAQRTDMPLPMLKFLKRLLLAELSPPADSDANGALFLARVDKLLDMGALEEAAALVERAGPTTPALFRRWFDISLLTGLEDQACRVMIAKPEIAPTYPARVFCLARSGDWSAAAVTLNTAKLLNLIDVQEEALLARFLDPELFEGEPALPVPERITPLGYQMHAAIGEPLNLSGLPNAFAFAATAQTEAWKNRITAAERLVRSGAIAPKDLMALYKEQAAAASGGVWDRVDAVQGFDAKLLADDPSGVSAMLPETLRPLRRVGLIPAFSEVYGERLARMELSPQAQQTALAVELMSAKYEQIARSARIADTTDPLLIGIATGEVASLDQDTPLREAVSSAFRLDEVPAEFDGMFADKKSGEIALRAMLLLQDGADGDPGNIETGLRLFRALGLEDLARRTALNILLATAPL